LVFEKGEEMNNPTHPFPIKQEVKISLLTQLYQKLEETEKEYEKYKLYTPHYETKINTIKHDIELVENAVKIFGATILIEPSPIERKDFIRWLCVKINEILGEVKK
jgi:hypothetical protein